MVGVCLLGNLGGALVCIGSCLVEHGYPLVRSVLEGRVVTVEGLAGGHLLDTGCHLHEDIAASILVMLYDVVWYHGLLPYLVGLYGLLVVTEECYVVLVTHLVNLDQVL